MTKFYEIYSHHPPCIIDENVIESKQTSLMTKVISTMLIKMKYEKLKEALLVST